MSRVDLFLFILDHVGWCELFSNYSDVNFRSFIFVIFALFPCTPGTFLAEAMLIYAHVYHASEHWFLTGDIGAVMLSFSCAPPACYLFVRADGYKFKSASNG